MVGGAWQLSGGTDTGAPGDRPYHPGDFAAFVLDPDGNTIEVVFHGPARRSADAVAITASRLARSSPPAR